jgi:type IV secretion system protein TrbL
MHQKINPHLFIFLICVLLASHEVHAQILDSIDVTYQSASSSWLGKMMPIAKGLFWRLATIEFAWSAIVWAVQQENLQSFTAVVIKKIMGIGFFYALLINAGDWMPAIINSFAKAGQTAGSGSLTPSQVVDTGIHFANIVLAAIEKKSLWKDSMTVIVGGLSALGMVLAFTIIAGQLLIALIESYIVVSAGVLFLGFGGSRWTTDFTQKYLSYAVATGIKLFMLYLIVSLGMTEAEAWQGLLKTSKYSDMISVLGASLILCFLAFQIPNMAASMLSGAPSLTAGAAMGTAGAVAAGTVAAGGAAMSPALQSARGGMQALKAGYEHHRTAGSGILGSALKAVGTSTVDYGREAMRSGGEVMGLANPTESRAMSIGGRAAETRRAATDTLRAEQAASGSAASAQVPPPPPKQATTPAAEAAPAEPKQSGQEQTATRQASDTMQDAPPAKMGSAAPQTTASNVAATSGAGASNQQQPPGRAKTMKTTDAGDATWNSDAAEASAAGTRPKTTAHPPTIQQTPSGSAPTSTATVPSSSSASTPEKPILGDIQQVRPPEIPNDAAPQAGINIQIHHSDD